MRTLNKMEGDLCVNLTKNEFHHIHRGIIQSKLKVLNLDLSF